MRVWILLLCPLFTACQPASSEQGEEAHSAADTTVEAKPAEEQAPSSLERAKAMGFDSNYLMGKFNPADHPDFVVIDNKYADRSGLRLRREAYEAFKAMEAAAKAAGLELVIRSATRNFNYQKGIWERKWTGQRRLSSGKNAAEAYPGAEERALAILKYSAMPGTSRHHWGTDIDLNAFNNAYFESGKGLAIYQWLSEHAIEYGFCQPYTAKGEARPNGYNEEKWHWSYLPIAQPLTTLAEAELTNEMISGFQGAEAASSIDVLNNYILGINPLCISR